MRMLFAAILLSSFTAAALAQGYDPDRQLTENPKAHLELPRKVTDMTCIKTGLTTFVRHVAFKAAEIRIWKPR